MSYFIQQIKGHSQHVFEPTATSDRHTQIIVGRKTKKV